MNFEWLLNPLTVYATSALVLWGCLLFFLFTKRELRAVRRLANQVAADADAKMKNLSAEMQVVRLAGSIKEALSAKEQVSPSSPSPARPASQGVNPDRRAQALRMHRQGEPVSSIATAIQASSSEIALMIKVEQILKGAVPGSSIN